MITFHITISAHRTAEEFNGFAIGIFFRRRTEGSLTPHQIEESRIVLGYQWPNLYHQIEEDLIVHTPSRSSSVTGVRTSGTTTPVDLPSEEVEEQLHKIPFPPDPLPEIEGLPSVSDINRRTEELQQRIEAHNQTLREQPSTPSQCLAAILARIQSGVNLDKVAFREVLRFNLVRVEVRELRPEVIVESDEVLVHYRSRTNVRRGLSTKTLA